MFKYSVKEKKAFKRGLFLGLFKNSKRREKVNKKKKNVNCKNVSKKEINHSSDELKNFSFIGIDNNGYRFNITCPGKDKTDAMNLARKQLKDEGFVDFCDGWIPNSGEVRIERKNRF